jgi:ribosomal protein S18 acetylase RimI-like enzyme
MNPESINVRRATTADVDTIAAFNQAMAQETERKTLDAATATEGVRRGLADPGRSLYFIAEVGGVAAGQTMVTTEWSDWRNGFFWWIQSVYVDPSFRRRGVFRALHAHIRNLARGQEEVCGLRLYVHHTNQRALATYRTLGMNPTDYVLCEEEWPAPKHAVETAT